MLLFIIGRSSEWEYNIPFETAKLEEKGTQLDGLSYLGCILLVHIHH